MAFSTKIRARLTAAAIVAGTLAASPAFAGGGTISGTSNGMTWEATSRVVGQTPTGTGDAAATPPTNGPGDPIYLGTAAQYRGTVGLLMDYGVNAQGVPQRFVCSGSLLNDRRSIATAAHCVSSGAGTANPLTTTVFFYDGTDTNASIYAGSLGGSPTPGVTTRNVGAYHVNSGYTGEVIDQNDIAILSLTDLAPTFANSYEIFGGNELTGTNFNVAGYGLRSAVGGQEGYTDAGAGQGTGRLRQGDNRYDFRLGDSDFNGFFTNINPATGRKFFGTAAVDFSYLSDFDNGNALNDASCRLAVAINPTLAGNDKYCNTGLGAREVNIAGGDSGGPGFVNGQLASINSYGLSFGPAFGDAKAGIQSSWGEFSGYVPTFIHRQFIASAMAAGVPEPSTWAQLLLGFGVLGFAARRRRAPKVVFAA